jgi:23S rRNA (uracil1939-C5)-methyltransferase
MLNAGTNVELTLERPVAGGRMLARHEGQVVLVAGAIPGERVRARIERIQRGMAFATTVDVLEASAARRVTVGDPLCGGNVYAHVAYAEQAAIKRDVLRDALHHGGRIEWPGELRVTPSPERSYRMRARLHVRRGRVGFFREGTHDLCDCSGTGQLLPAAVEAGRAFVDATPRAVRDAIDAIELSESLTGDERVLHVLWMPNTRLPRAPLDALWDLEHLPGVTGVSCDDPSTGRARTVTGRPWVTDQLSALMRQGPPWIAPTAIVDEAALPSSQNARQDPVRSPGDDARLQRHATSFFQANRFLVSNLVRAVHAVVADGPIVDLYAGVGLFAVTLAARAGTHAPVTAVEGDPSSARDLAVNAQPFGERLHVEHAPVEQYLERVSPPPTTTLIVDPPRTGMSRQALDGVLRSNVARIVYVSCDVATLSRDLRRLLDAQYTLDHIEAFDLFPNTAHIESLAVLSQ